MRAAAALCESLGHNVEEATPDIDAGFLFDKFTMMLAVGTAVGVRDAERTMGRRATADDLEPLVWQLAQRRERLNAAEYLMAVQDLQLLTRKVAGFHQTYDVLLTPTLGRPPARLGSFRMDVDDDPTTVRQRMWTFAPFTQLQNVTGQPAMSLPLHWNTRGLPIGVQIVGRFGYETTLFGLAGQLEAAQPWAQR